MQKVLTFWRRVTEPADTIQDSEQRRLSRLLASIMILLSLLSFGLFLLRTPTNLATGAELLSRIMIAALALVFYWLSREGRYRLVSSLTVISGSIIIFALAIQPDSESLQILNYLAVIILFGSLFLPRHAIWIIFIVQIATMVLLMPLMPGVTFASVLQGPVTLNLTLSIVTFMIVTHRDMLEADRREKLAASEKSYRMLADNATDVIWLLDLAGRFNYISPSMERLLGYKPEALIQSMASKVLTPESWQIVEASIQGISERVSQSAKLYPERAHYELELFCKDGSTIWAETASSVMYDAEDDTINILGVTRDITARKQAEEERERLIADLDAFAHSVAHDLKNPINVIIGYGEMLSVMESQIDAEARRRYVQGIVQNGRKMVAIINALLLLAGVRTQDEVPITSLDTANILSEVQKRLANMIEDRRAEIALHTETHKWPAALGYAPWVEEVWVNYLSNALKYGAAEGAAPHVELGAASLDAAQMIRFWVRDKGPGITSEDQAQLFTPFTQLKQANTEGHGLGLSIVKRIVEKLGGQVGVESAPGEGSTFFFTLPAAK